MVSLGKSSPTTEIKLEMNKVEAERLISYKPSHYFIVFPRVSIASNATVPTNNFHSINFLANSIKLQKIFSAIE